MRVARVVAVCSMICLLSGCAGFLVAPVVPPPGLVYSDIKAPLDVGLDNTDLGSKVGVAETVSIMGLWATGDASIKAAADPGNITTVKHIDYHLFNVMGFYSRFVTTVYGD